MKPTITWVVLADGAHARFLEHRGPGSGFIENTSLELSREARRSGEIMSDRPGRSFSSSGHGRSAMEPPTDAAEKEEVDFMRIVAEAIAKAHAAKRFERLIVAAPPRALGELRKALPKHVSDAITAELHKDLVHQPLNDIPGHFESVMAV